MDGRMDLLSGTGVSTSLRIVQRLKDIEQKQRFNQKFCDLANKGIILFSSFSLHLRSRVQLRYLAPRSLLPQGNLQNAPHLATKERNAFHLQAQTFKSKLLTFFYHYTDSGGTNKDAHKHGWPPKCLTLNEITWFTLKEIWHE